MQKQGKLVEREKPMFFQQEKNMPGNLQITSISTKNDSFLKISQFFILPALTFALVVILNPPHQRPCPDSDLQYFSCQRRYGLYGWLVGHMAGGEQIDSCSYTCQNRNPRNEPCENKVRIKL